MASPAAAPHADDGGDESSSWEGLSDAGSWQNLRGLKLVPDADDLDLPSEPAPLPLSSGTPGGVPSDGDAPQPTTTFFDTFCAVVSRSTAGRVWEALEKLSHL